MTRELLAILGEAATPMETLLGSGLICFLLPLTLTFDALEVLWKRVQLWVFCRETQVRCAAGHSIELISDGGWTCETCGMPSAPGSHAWAPCQHCGAIEYAVACPLCHQVAVNPLFPLLQDDTNR